jgi:hypothetical protein
MRMASISCETLIYFIGGLDKVKSNQKNGISIMHEAVHTRLSSAMNGSYKVLLHQFEQSTAIPRRSQKHGPTIPVFTSLTADLHAKGIDLAIHRAVEENSPKRLVVIAYSCGSALFRRALADRKNSRSPSWTEKLAKVFYIGGMATGWQFNSEIPKPYLLFGPLVRTLLPGWFPWQLYKGSKFITETRIKLNRKAYDDRSKDNKPLPEIQLLGTKDEYISPVDAIEPGGEPESSKSAYLEVRGCTHQTILSTEDNGEANKDVLNFIIQSLPDEGYDLNGLATLRKIHPDDINDYLDPLDNEPARRDDSVDRVFIILHGIRDNGTWAQRIGSHIKEKWRQQKEQENPRSVRVVTASYGYFSMWDFLRPGGRANAIEWYQNLYADVCALYPKAKISFVGHSNGTYLGTEALQCEGLTYEVMVLAGSVVRRDFWINRKKGGAWRSRVQRVFNFRSVNDWVVGLLPGGLEVIPVLGDLMNLGGAGAYGFHWPPRRQKPKISTTEDKTATIIDPSKQEQAQRKDQKKDRMFELTERIIYGGHGAAIKSDTWDQLAEYLLFGGSPGIDGHLKPIERRDRPVWWFANNFTKSTWILRAIFGAAVYVALIICASPFLLPVLALSNIVSPSLMVNFPLIMVISLGLSVVLFAVLRRF